MFSGCKRLHRKAGSATAATQVNHDSTLFKAIKESLKKNSKRLRSLSVQKTQMDLSYKMLDTAIYNDNKLKVRRKRFPAVPFVEASVEKLCTAKRNVSFSGCLSNSPTS